MDDYNMNNDDMGTEQGGYSEESKGMSPVKLCVILASIVLIIAIVFATLSSISIDKKKAKDVSSKKQDEVVLVDENKKSTNDGNSEKVVESAKETEKTSEKEGTETVTNTDKTVSQNTEENTVPIEEITDQVLDSEVKSVSVIVSGKSIYKVENECYTYSLNLIFPDGDGYKVIKYFCSKKSYDTVEKGETITAEYQLDSNGVISIRTVTK